jgi:hypothetical protein
MKDEWESLSDSKPEIQLCSNDPFNSYSKRLKGKEG